MPGSTLIKELQYYFKNFILTSSVNKDNIPVPANIPDYFFTNDNSFIKLLFDDTWNEINYEYNFLKNEDRFTWPMSIKDRLLIYPQNSQVYDLSTDSTAINFFILQSDDFLLLDSLLIYRSDSVNFTITDSTANILIGMDLFVNFDLLSTELSKLIYVYLMAKKNTDYSKYESLSNLISSTNNILTNMYEKYILENLFQIVSGN